MNTLALITARLDDTRFTILAWRDGQLSWPKWFGLIQRCLPAYRVTHPSSNTDRDQCSISVQNRTLYSLTAQL